MPQKAEASAQARPIFDPVAALQPLAPALWMSIAWLENLTDLPTAFTSFVAGRLHEDAKAQHAMLHCKSFADVQHAQAQFLQRMFDQYVAEAGKLVAIGTEMAAKANGAVTTGA